MMKIVIYYYKFTVIGYNCYQMSYFKIKMHEIRFRRVDSAPTDILAGFKGVYF